MYKYGYEMYKYGYEMYKYGYEIEIPRASRNLTSIGIQIQNTEDTRHKNQFIQFITCLRHSLIFITHIHHHNGTSHGPNHRRPFFTTRGGIEVGGTRNPSLFA